LAYICNSIKEGSATTLSGAHIATSCESSEKGLIREIIFGIFLRSQPGPANELYGVDPNCDLVCLGSNFQQPGPTPGNPYMSAMYLSCGEFGSHPLGTLMKNQYHQRGAAYLVDCIISYYSMDLKDVLVMTAKEAYSRFCSHNGKKSLLTETSASAVSLMASSIADALVAGDYHRVISAQADFDGSQMRDSAASIASFLTSISDSSIPGHYHANAVEIDAREGSETKHSKTVSAVQSWARARADTGEVSHDQALEENDDRFGTRFRFSVPAVTARISAAVAAGTFPSAAEGRRTQDALHDTKFLLSTCCSNSLFFGYSSCYKYNALYRTPRE
jgi:hypothetical protein